MKIFLGYFLIYMKRSPIYPDAHAQVKKWVFPFRFPGKGFEPGIISNDFWSSTIWDVQIQVQTMSQKILKILEFNLAIGYRTFI